MKANFITLFLFVIELMEIPTWVYFIDGPITTYLNRNTTKYFHNLKGLSTCKFYKLVNKKKKKKKN